MADPTTSKATSSEVPRTGGHAYKQSVGMASSLFGDAGDDPFASINGSTLTSMPEDEEDENAVADALQEQNPQSACKLKMACLSECRWLLVVFKHGRILQSTTKDRA